MQPLAVGWRHSTLNVQMLAKTAAEQQLFTVTFAFIHGHSHAYSHSHSHFHAHAHTLSAACNQRLMQIVRQTRISEFLPIFLALLLTLTLARSLCLSLSVAVCLAFSLVFVMYFIRHVNMPSAYVYQRNFWKKKLNFPNGIWYTRQTEQRTHTHTQRHLRRLQASVTDILAYYGRECACVCVCLGVCV